MARISNRERIERRLSTVTDSIEAAAPAENESSNCCEGLMVCDSCNGEDGK